VGNALIDRYWHLWMVDCSRCFVTMAKPLTLDRVTRCERTLWRRLNELSDDEIRTAMQPYLSRPELTALIKRRAAVVARIAALIAQKGEGSVLFDLGPPPAEPARW
jgi:hypothetical protein